MLILTRREGESIVISLPGIDHAIESRVMKAAAQVSLGIDAPREVTVLREELVQE
jgi:carbon storage regulator CsrA